MPNNAEGSCVAHGHLQRCPCQSHDRFTHFTHSTPGSERGLGHQLYLLVQMYQAPAAIPRCFPTRMHLRGCRKLRFILVSPPLPLAWRRTLGQPMMRFHNLMLLTQKTPLQSPARAHCRMQGISENSLLSQVHAKVFGHESRRCGEGKRLYCRELGLGRVFFAVLLLFRKCGTTSREAGPCRGRITKRHHMFAAQCLQGGSHTNHTASQHLLPSDNRAGS